MAKHNDEDQRTLFNRANTRNPTPVELHEESSGFWIMILVLFLIFLAAAAWIYWRFAR